MVTWRNNEGAALADSRRSGGATSPDIRTLGHVFGRILELELDREGGGAGKGRVLGEVQPGKYRREQRRAKAAEQGSRKGAKGYEGPDPNKAARMAM